MFDGRSLGPFAVLDNGLVPAEVGIGRRHVSQAFVATPLIIVSDESLDLGLKIAGQEVVFQQDAVLHGLAPALDPALRLGMKRRAARMADALGFNVFYQLAGDVAGSICPTAAHCDACLPTHSPRQPEQGPAYG